MEYSTNTERFSTTDPPEGWEGSGATVPPPHTCLQAVGDSSGYCEICRSQETQGPNPGYDMRGRSSEGVPAHPTTSESNREESENENNGRQTERYNENTRASIDDSIHYDEEADLRETLSRWNEYQELERLSEELNKPMNTSAPQQQRAQANKETEGQPLPQATTTEDQENDHSRKSKGKKKKKKQRKRANNKASTRIGTLNIRGYGDQNLFSKKNRWMHVNQLMRDRGYGILAVQETHLNDERITEINRTHGNRFKVYGSNDPDNPTAKGGVAIVIKKDKFLNPEPILTREIVPGRAIVVKLKWHKTLDENGKEKWTTLTIMAIYAPNVTEHDGKESRTFWETIENYYDKHPSTPKPDVMLGDFNIVENTSLDRLPQRNDPEEARDALDSLKMELNLSDEWRETHPTTREFTYTQIATGSKSRLDRIYLGEHLKETAREWRNTNSPLSGADHNMVSVRISCEKAPETGPGRPTIPIHMLQDKQFMDYLTKEGIKALQKQSEREERTDEENPQTDLFNWKMKVREKAWQRAKIVKPRIDRQIEELTRDLQTTLNDPTTDEETKVKMGIETATKLASLEQQKHAWKRDQIRARNRIEGETVCKYWIETSKEKKPRDVIYALEIKEKQNNTDTPIQAEPPSNRRDEQQTEAEPQQGNMATTPEQSTQETQDSTLVGETREKRKTFETDSKRMAEIAKEHHDAIQLDGFNETHPEREKIIEETLGDLATELSPGQQEEAMANTNGNNTTMALILSENGTSPGIDGFPFELYKEAQRRNKENEKLGRKGGFDIVRLLTAAFIDIEEHGVSPRTGFAEGWMCPLYKKKEKTDIANYRPITLLNTDYKIFTKTIAMKLAKVAPHLLHKNQAGFVPGRNITDQTQLIRTIMHFAETKKANGLIVALDQEKAYDKIAHDYLWKALERFKFPDKFINTIKSLYTNAETRVMINGYLSNSFRITRGVRQGDPMSCILFDLAIEPLGAMIRNSELKGYQIGENEPERVIVNMFADDTTVFLAKEDSIETLKGITDKWCAASRARFNEGKTEIIPIGDKQYRSEVVTTRKTSPLLAEIPREKHIASDGEATRILGAWFGSEIDQEGIWTPVLEKIDASLARWEKTGPTMEGRRHIVQFTVGGMTQYLTKVQGMTKTIEKRLERRINKFVWKEKGQYPVNGATVQSMFEIGGRKVLDIDARNEAIKITWVQTYLNIDDRPTWAKVADEIFKCYTTKAKKLPKDALLNPLMQSWKPNTSTTTKLPKFLAEIITTAKKYNLSFDGIKIAREAIDEMPIWYHIKADHKIMHEKAKGMVSACLRRNHNMMNVRQANITASLLNAHNHTATENEKCECEGCHTDRAALGCKHPNWCATRAKELLDLLPEKWDPREVPYEEDEEIEGEKEWTAFEPGLITAKTTGETMRMFDQRDEEDKSNKIPRYARVDRLRPTNQTSQTVATDGSCLNNGLDNAAAGAGAFFGDNSPRNKSVRLPNDIEQSNQTGELIAIKLAIENTDPDQELRIETDSKYAIGCLTRNRNKNEDEGYIETKHASIIKDLLIGLRRRTARTLFKWVKGHQGYGPNEKADRLAGEGAMKPIPDAMSDWTQGTLSLEGAKLTKLTQALAYRKIRQMKEAETKERERTKVTIALAKAQTEEIFGIIPTEGAIWKATRSKEYAMQTRQFLWMTAHDAYMVGDKWTRKSNPAEMKERAMCKHCEGKLESMTHILTECESPGQKEIWDLAKNTWERKSTNPWIKPSTGAVISAGLAAIKDAKTKKLKTGENRLWKIMVAESAHLIWRLRCERVIGKNNEPFEPEAVRARWENTINERIKLDRLLTNKKRYANKALSEKKVENTWKYTLRDEGDLPTDWVRRSGVLVGIEMDQARRKGTRGRRRQPPPQPARQEG